MANNIALKFADEPYITYLDCDDMMSSKKLETQFKQVLRERKLREGKAFQSDETTLANFLLAYVEGKMNQFVRSDFKAKPSSQFEKQWPELQKIWL